MIPVGLLPRSSPAASLATLAEAMPSSEQRLLFLRLAQGVQTGWGRGCLAKVNLSLVPAKQGNLSLVPAKQEGPAGWGQAWEARCSLPPARTWSREEGGSAEGLW